MARGPPRFVSATTMARDGMFLDEAELRVRAGRGGDGCVSFRREKYVAFGGPDGGDGGAGGDVVFTATHGETSLFRLARSAEARAGNGQPGGGNNRTGARGEDKHLRVPVGTQVFDSERGNLLADLDRDGATLVVARGGKHGRGNARFASAENQAPRHFEKGQDGEARHLRLELKLVAEVGLIGLPNAGKSTLLSRLTSARPRVAAYPFTTLDPALGILETGVAERPTLVLADIPGLIEGASEGKGLGHRFLRHIERTRILLHLVDCSSMATDDPVEAHDTVAAELAAYSEVLASLPRIVVATKVEDEEAVARAAALREATGGEVLEISSAMSQGLQPLVRRLLREGNPES